jgi:hypothetical protein
MQYQFPKSLQNFDQKTCSSDGGQRPPSKNPKADESCEQSKATQFAKPRHLFSTAQENPLPPS